MLLDLLCCCKLGSQNLLDTPRCGLGDDDDDKDDNVDSA